MSLALDSILIKKQSIASADERPLTAAAEEGFEACPPGTSSAPPEPLGAVEGGGGGGEPSGWGSTRDSTDEKRSFREKILAFERFSGRRLQSSPAVDGLRKQSRGGRWTKHLPSSSSSKATTASSSSETRKRDRKDDSGKNRNKNEDCGADSLPVQPDGREEEVDDNDGGSRDAAGGGGGDGDGGEGGLEKKMHWTVRLSQQLMKIRGKLEHRNRSRQRNDPEKVAAAARRQSDLESKSSGLAASRSSISSIFHQSDSGLGNSSTSVAVPDRGGSVISRSCSELNRRSRRSGGVDELLLERNWNEEEEEDGEEETKPGCSSSSRRSQSTGFLGKEEDFEEEEEEGGGEKARRAATKTSFLSELRKFYDRNSARKSSEKRGGFFKAGRKSKAVSGRTVQKQEATYIEADRIDKDVTTSTTTTSGASEEEEAKTTSGVPDNLTSVARETLDTDAHHRHHHHHHHQPMGTGKESSGSKESGRKRQQQVTPVPWKKPLSGISVFTEVGDIGEGSEVKVDRWENGGWEDDHLSPETSEANNFEEEAIQQK